MLENLMEMVKPITETTETVLKLASFSSSRGRCEFGNEIHEHTSISSDAERHGESDSGIIFLERVIFFLRMAEKR